jgi:hypothetical protein
VKRTNHIFVINRPGHDLDGEEWRVYGTEAEANETAAEYVRDWAKLDVTVGLTKLGTRSYGVLTPCVPISALPWWAAEQVAKPMSKRSRACRHDFSDGDVCSKCDSVRRSA